MWWEQLTLGVVLNFSNFFGGLVDPPSCILNSSPAHKTPYQCGGLEHPGFLKWQAQIISPILVTESAHWGMPRKERMAWWLAVCDRLEVCDLRQSGTLVWWGLASSFPDLLRVGIAESQTRLSNFTGSLVAWCYRIYLLFLRKLCQGRRVQDGNTCIPVADSCWCMAKPIQYCKVISLQLK